MGVVPLLAIVVSVNQVSAKLVVFLLAVVLAGLHGGPTFQREALLSEEIVARFRPQQKMTIAGVYDAVTEAEGACGLICVRALCRKRLWHVGHGAVGTLACQDLAFGERTFILATGSIVQKGRFHGFDFPA